MKLKQLDQYHFKDNLRVYENGNGKFQVSVEMGNRNYKCLVSTNVIYVNKSIHTICALASTVNHPVIPSSKMVIMKGLSVELFTDGIEGVENVTLLIADSIFEAAQMSRMIVIPHQLIANENEEIDYTRKLVIIPYVYCKFDSLRTKTFYRTIYSVNIANLIHCKSRFVYCLVDSRIGLEPWRYTFQTMILLGLFKPYVHFYERYQKCPSCCQERDKLLLFNCCHYCCKWCMTKVKNSRCLFCKTNIVNVEYIDDEMKPYFQKNTIVFKDYPTLFEEELVAYQSKTTSMIFASLETLKWCDVTGIDQVIVYCEPVLTPEMIQKILNICCVLKSITLRVSYSTASVLKMWEQKLLENF